MPQITLELKTAINPLQIISAATMRQKYLFGLPLASRVTQEPLADSTIDFYINSAIKLMESSLGIKLAKQKIVETRDFNYDDWIQWGFVKVTYPVVCPLSLKGFLGTTKQVDYPNSWLSARSANVDGTYSRQINLVPTQNTSQADAIVYSGIMPNAGLLGVNKNIPNYWHVEYTTGFDQIPPDIMQAIGMLASLPILAVLGDIMFPWPGVNSSSISLDGLSQSTSTASQAGAFGARIKQYSDQLFNEKNGLINTLRDNYGAIIWAVA